MMDLKQLRHFTAVAAHLNFRRAAAELHIAQPALSASIQKLEQDIGTPLFNRERRSITLTDAGRAAIEDAKAALDCAARMRQQALAALQGRVGVLRLCYVGTSTYSVLPLALERFKKTCPGIQVQLQESSADVIIDALQRRTYDIAIARYPMRAVAGLSFEVVEEDRLCVVLPLGHPLGKRKQVRLSDLSNEIFVVPTAANNPALRGLIVQACQVSGFMPRLAQEEAVQIPTVLALIEGGFGIAILPAKVMQSVRRRVTFHHLSGKPGQLATGLGILYSGSILTTQASLFREAILSLT